MRLTMRIREFLVRCFLPKNARVTFSPKPKDVWPEEFHHTEPPEITDPDFLFGGFEPRPYHCIQLTLGEIDLRNNEPEYAKQQPWPEGYSIEGDIVDERDVFFKEGWSRPLSAVFSKSTAK